MIILGSTNGFRLSVLVVPSSFIELISEFLIASELPSSFPLLIRNRISLELCTIHKRSANNVEGIVNPLLFINLATHRHYIISAHSPIDHALVFFILLELVFGIIDFVIRHMAVDYPLVPLKFRLIKCDQWRAEGRCVSLVQPDMLMQFDAFGAFEFAQILNLVLLLQLSGQMHHIGASWIACGAAAGMSRLNISSPLADGLEVPHPDPVIKSAISIKHKGPRFRMPVMMMTFLMRMPVPVLMAVTVAAAASSMLGL